MTELVLCFVLCTSAGVYLTQESAGWRLSLTCDVAMMVLRIKLAVTISPALAKRILLCIEPQWYPRFWRRTQGGRSSCRGVVLLPRSADFVVLVLRLPYFEHFFDKRSFEERGSQLLSWNSLFCHQAIITGDVVQTKTSPCIILAESDVLMNTASETRPVELGDVSALQHQFSD